MPGSQDSNEQQPDEKRHRSEQRQDCTFCRSVRGEYQYHTSCYH